MIWTFTNVASSFGFSILIKCKTTMEIRSCPEHVFNKSCLFIKTSSVFDLFSVWGNQLGPYIHRKRVVYFVPYLIDNEHGWPKISGSLLCFKQSPVVLEEALFYYEAPVNKNFSKKRYFPFILSAYNLWLFNTSSFREDLRQLWMTTRSTTESRLDLHHLLTKQSIQLSRLIRLLHHFLSPSRSANIMLMQKTK